MSDRFEQWLEPVHNETRHWLVGLSSMRLSLLSDPTKHDPAVVLFYSAQLLYLTACVKRDASLMCRVDMQFRCTEFHTNFVGGEAIHTAIQAARMLINRAADWDGEETPLADRSELLRTYRTRAKPLSWCVWVLNGCIAVLAEWVDLGEDDRRALSLSLTNLLHTVRALLFWLQSCNQDDVLPPLPSVDMDAGLLGRAEDRLEALCSAEILAPAAAKQARKGWSSNLRAKRLLAQACVARCRRKHDAAAAFMRAAAELGYPPEEKEFMDIGDMDLRTAEREAPCHNHVDEHFVKGNAIACSVQFMGDPFAPVFTV